MESETCETPVCCCVCLGVFMCYKPPLHTSQKGIAVESFTECAGQAESALPGTAGLGTSAKLVLGLSRGAQSPRQD